jgi:hypothetical protein
LEPICVNPSHNKINIDLKKTKTNRKGDEMAIIEPEKHPQNCSCEECREVIFDDER